MADYHVVTTNTPPQHSATHVPEDPGHGPVHYVGATDSLQRLWPNSVLVNDNMIQDEVNTLSLRTRVPEQGSVNSLTRVMSPNDPSNMMLEANQTVLLGIQCQCQICHMMSPDPSLCANCGAYGHPICLGVEHFQGYAFCHGCMGVVTGQYASMNDAHLRQEWQLSLSRQVWSWRESARDAIGASASIGIAVGGAAATAAGAAFAVAQGIVEGVQVPRQAVVCRPLCLHHHNRTHQHLKQLQSVGLTRLEIWLEEQVKSVPSVILDSESHTPTADRVKAYHQQPTSVPKVPG